MRTLPHSAEIQRKLPSSANQRMSQELDSTDDLGVECPLHVRWQCLEGGMIGYSVAQSLKVEPYPPFHGINPTLTHQIPSSRLSHQRWVVEMSLIKSDA